MKRSIAVLFLLLFLEVLFWACCNPPDNSYGIISMESTVSVIDSLEQDRVQLIPAHSGNVIPYNAFAIKLVTEVEALSIAKPTGTPTAYACEDPAPSIAAVFESVRITSGVAYDQDHPPGTDLAEIFRLGYSYYPWENEYWSSAPIESVKGMRVPFDYFLFTALPPSDPDLNRRFFI
ncbi:MAG: hypothetical protein P8X57_15120, partial [Cyclobacteriaceae bacterium]